MPTTRALIQRRIAALNAKLRRPAHFFTPANGSPARASIGHITFDYNHAQGGYQLIQVISTDGEVTEDVLGLNGERFEAKCFAALLAVAIAALDVEKIEA